jgi:hypothetical protein
MRLGGGLGGLVLAITITMPGLGSGCADPAPADGSSSSTDAVTLASGHKYVVRTSSTQVVLRRKADGRAFPFPLERMLGKAILIHPVDAVSDGVYGRVLSGEQDENEITLATEPLSLEEMENLRDEDVVKIYLDPTLDAPRAERSMMEPPTLFREDVKAGAIGPRGWGGGLFGGDLTAMGELELPGGIKTENNITVRYEGGRMHLAPSILATYSRERGLEVGLKSTFTWNSAIAISGDTNLRAKIFRTPRVGPPGIWVTVPIGVVPVPIRLRLVGFLECESMGKTQFDGKLTMAISAHAGGSIRIKPNGGPLATWVSEGPWPFDVGGSASANLTGKIYPGAGSGIECSLPRVELETLVAGVAGPYLAIAPEFRRVRSQEGPPENSMNITLKVGMRGKLFGREANGELDLVSWVPEEPAAPRVNATQ